MKSGDIRRTILGEAEAWIAKFLDRLASELRESSGEPQGDPERRIKLLTLVKTQVEERFKAQADALWKARVQRTFLASACLLLLIVVGVGTWALLNTESRATAKAWRILVQRQLLAAKTGREVSKGAMVWLMARIKEVEADSSATPEERAIWKANIHQIAQQVNIRIQVAEQAVQRLSTAETPSRIDSFTYFRDPFTGRTLPVNATEDGRIDDAAVDTYTKQDDQMLRLVAMAKAYSQKGAPPLPPFLFDETPRSSQEKLNPTGESK